MKALLVSLLGLTLAGAAVPANAATEADCRTMWEKADANKDATLDGSEATAYLNAIKSSGKVYDKDSNGKLVATEFTDACLADTFKDIK